MLILILLILPLVTGLGLVLFPSISSATAKLVSKAVSILSLVVSFFGASQLAKGNLTLLTYQKTWLAGQNINFSFEADGISMVLLLLTGILVPVIIHLAGAYNYKQNALLYGLILFTQFALTGVFTAKDIFLFYFFFEISLVPVYFLALKWGGTDASKITFRMFVYTIFGSLIMLAALIYLYSKGQTAAITDLAITAKALPANINTFLFVAFMLAFAIKMPLFPMHTWQPEAYAESPSPATSLLAGLLSKMGVYGLIRIALPLAPIGWANLKMVFIILAIIGLIYGSIIAIKQNKLKYILAYSSFAHMGLMAAGVLTGSMAGLQGAIVQMFAHGINVVGLFYVVKILENRTGMRSLESLGGLSQKAPKLTVVFVIFMLGSVALPLTNGFPGEFLLLKSVFDYHHILGGFAGITIILGAVYMLRMIQKSMFGTLSVQNENIADLSFGEMSVLYPLVFLVIFLGVHPNLILNLTAGSIENIFALINF